MSYGTLSAILNLISTSSLHLQYPEAGLIRQLNNFYSFDQNIFLVNSTADVNRFIDTNQTECTPKTIHTFKSAEDGAVTVVSPLKKIISKNTLLIVVSGKPTLDLRLVVKEIQRLQLRMKIGMFISHAVSKYDLHDLFQWFWRNGIVNVFAAFRSNCVVPQGTSLGPLLNIFTFNPFGTFSVINLTASETFDSFFLKQNSNFQRHPIRIPILKATPIRTHEQQLWENIINVLNASAIEVYQKANEHVLEMFRDDLIDCSTYLLAFDDFDSLQNMLLYPMTFEELLIVVPEALPYPQFLAYLQTIMSDKFCIYSITAVVSVIFMLTISRYVQQKKIVFFESAVDVLNLIMNDNGAIKYQKLSHPEVFLIVPITFTGLIVVNGVISIMGSFLTRPFMQPQINTFDDIYNSPYPILVQSDWANIIFEMLSNLSKHEDWRNKLRLSEATEQNREMLALNTSISFPMMRTGAKNVVKSQRRLNIIGYHIPTHASFDMFLTTFAISDNFPLMERLNEIIHWMRNAGLFEKWMEAKHLKFNVTKVGKSDVESFPIPTFIAYGWALGCIVFVVEIVWRKLSWRKCLIA